MKGFAIIRGGILDHLLAGSISFTELGVYLVIHLQVDFRTGVWRGSAPRLTAAAPRGVNLREVQRALQNLVAQGFLKSFHVRGKRGNFCVLVDRYEIKIGALKGKRLIAAKSTDWRNPHYESCAESVAEDDADSDAESVAEGAPVSRINRQQSGVRNKSNALRATSPLSHPFAEIWNQQRGPLAEVTRLTVKRVAKCRLRAAELSEEEFRSVVQLAASTPFCVGVNDRGWKVDFDWLIESESNWLKVKEGRYSGGRNGIGHDHATTDSAAARVLARFN